MKNQKIKIKCFNATICMQYVFVIFKICFDNASRYVESIPYLSMLEVILYNKIHIFRFDNTYKIIFWKSTPENQRFPGA